MIELGLLVTYLAGFFFVLLHTTADGRLLGESIMWPMRIIMALCWPVLLLLTSLWWNP